MAHPEVRKNVDRILREKELTKRQLANFLEINETHVNRKLNDRASIDLLAKIASFLKCDVKDLIGSNSNYQNISGSGNAASYHGHAAIISTPENTTSKIINDDGITMTCEPVPDQKTQQRMKELENEVLILRTEAKHKSELIAKLSDEIEFLRGVINR